MRRRRPSVLVTAVAVFAITVSIGASSAQITRPNHEPRQQATVLAVHPLGLKDVPLDIVGSPAQALATLDGIKARADNATAEAAESGADIGFTLLDRGTGQEISEGDGAPFPIASVAKLFIADDLLLQVSQDQVQLTPEDRQALDVMLRSSDDSAAEVFWQRRGGNEVIARVTARYGLGSTSAPYDGHWWNTMSTTADLVRYYSMLLDGNGGLPMDQANIIMSDLAMSTPVGVDGYPQRFGIPDGLYAEPVAVKQGWMCCWNGANWLHMSTGVIGSSRRFVMAIVALQPVDDETARKTITQAVDTMFPGGRI
jgi:hypothetical protein